MTVRGDIKRREDGGLPTAFYAPGKRDWTPLYVVAAIGGMVTVATVAMAFMLVVVILAVCVTVCLVSVASMQGKQIKGRK